MDYDPMMGVGELDGVVFAMEMDQNCIMTATGIV